MTKTLRSVQKQTMAEFFDDYVHNVFPARREAAKATWQWPGDEWADAALQATTFKRILGDTETHRWQNVVEFGPGAGKYTRLILEETPARVLAYEISAAFVDVLEQRFATAMTDGRFQVRHVDWWENDGLLRDFKPRGAPADLVFAIDVFMMMDFQTVLVYLLSAACMLKPGGRLFATFADGSSESGWDRMLRDAGRHSAFDDSPCTRFHWVDAGMLEKVLPHLGFGALKMSHGPADGLDIARIYVDATLVDPQRARALADVLTPAEPV